MKNIFITLGLSVAFALSTANAQSVLQLGIPAHAGSGCPAGTASASLSPDGSALTLLFDQYVAEAGGMTGLSVDRKTCNISIPVLVPEGFSVSILTVDYRGFVSIPFGGSGRFSAEYFFAGSRGPIATKNFFSGSEGDFNITNNLGIQAMVWSPCGADVNLRVNTNMLVKTNRMMEDAMGVVDSADFQTGIVYHLKFQRCR